MRPKGGRGRFRRLALLALRRPFLSRGRRRWKTLLVGLALIVAWQATFMAARDRLDGSHVGVGASGITGGEVRFVYFLYYLDLFPVTSERWHAVLERSNRPDRYSREAAEHALRRWGRSLSTEWGHTIRVGEPGKVFLYLPYAIWKGTAANPSMRPFHSVVFVFALGSVFAAFWWARLPLLGGFLVLLVGLSPFQLYQVHAHDNVFGWPITAAMLVLALNLPLLHPGRLLRRSALAIPALTGLALATAGQVRSEPKTLLAAAAMACLFTPRATATLRLGLLGLLLGAYLGGSTAWYGYFDHKTAVAQRVVTEAGGQVYDGPRHRMHQLWHPIWCGLGDFDTRYGHRWHDDAAYAYATAVLGRSHGLDRFEHDVLWYDEYEQTLRAAVLDHIFSDPLWYLQILAKRVGRLAVETTPVRLGLGHVYLDLPMHGLGFAVLLALATLARSGVLVRLLLFPLATSLPALLIHSGSGMTNYSWYHLMAAAVALAIAVDVGISWAGRRAGRRGCHASE